ncbi:MAG: adenylosuccinate synthase [Bacilli bacterium]
MNKTVVVIGSQWGDEGKGKITNYLSEAADVIVRFQGGDNAGHTIVFDNNTYKLHLLPSGIFDENKKNIMGNGMVINPKSLIKELEDIRSYGFKCNNLYISDRAHVIFDYHKVLDVLIEESLGDLKIGTTKKGIGPAYTDKVSRIGIRMADFVSDDFEEIYYKHLALKNKEIVRLGGEPISKDSLKEYLVIREIIKPLVCDTISLINEEHKLGSKILFEGAQGALLDIDYGTYPYVTSSSPSSAGVVVGSGLGVNKINEVLGIVKAYTTRVGEGPFPSELNNSLGDHIREVGHEYGATTNRPRRIGWFDSVLLNYSSMVNGLTGLAIMLLDVLTGINELQICVSYTLDGKIINSIPARLKDFSRCKPNYISLPGWSEDITNVKSFDELPVNAKNYLRKIEELVGVEIKCFSVGPDREQTIIMKEII